MFLFPVEFSHSPVSFFQFHAWIALHHICTRVQAFAKFRCGINHDAGIAYANTLHTSLFTVCNNFHFSFSLFHISSSSAFCSITFSNSSLLWSIISDIVITTYACVHYLEVCMHTCTHKHTHTHTYTHTQPHIVTTHGISTCSHTLITERIFQLVRSLLLHLWYKTMFDVIIISHYRCSFF